MWYFAPDKNEVAHAYRITANLTDDQRKAIAGDIIDGLYDYQTGNVVKALVLDYVEQVRKHMAKGCRHCRKGLHAEPLGSDNPLCPCCGEESNHA